MNNNSTPNEEKGMGAFIFLFILLLVQTGCFAIIIISKCDHAAVRIYTGFVGIGLAVFPVFVRRVMVGSQNKSSGATERNSKIRQWNRGTGFIFNLIITLLTPWILWLMKTNEGLSFIETLTPAAIMQISTGALGFFIAGCIAFVRDFKTAGKAFNIFKAVLLLSLIVYALYMALPGLMHFGHWAAVAASNHSQAFLNVINRDPFWQYVAYTIGPDAIQWLAGFFICLYANIMAYKDGFLKK